MPQDQAAWRTIAADLRGSIQDGTYAPGSKIPSRADLMERWGVASQTVVAAINALRAEGLVVGRQGAGLFVTDRHPYRRMARHRLARAERQAGRGALMTDARASGRESRSELDAIRVEPADEQAANELDVPLGSEVLVRERRMWAGDEPVMLSISVLPRDITRGTQIEETDTGPGGLLARLEDAGHAIDHFEETVRIGRASEAEAKHLGVAPATPIFRIVRSTRTDERVLESNRIAMTGNAELIYEMPAE
jgi:GntR family transcriptional regulator